MTSDLFERSLRLITGGRDDNERDALIDALAEEQAARIAPYARLHARRATGAWPPALPTDVFRFARIATHDPIDDLRTFLTSGTTQGARGAHHFADMRAYDAAARRFAAEMLFPDIERMRLLVLAPSSEEAPESSLSYMLSRFAEWFGSDTDFVWPVDPRALSRVVATSEPVAILGTSFALAHAEDALDRAFTLAPGSRIMQTGGFKGRAKEVDPDTMLATLSARFGVPKSHIIAEYGMTEMSSQFYETTLRAALGLDDPGPRRLRAPHWVRVTPVDALTLEPAEGVGLLRIDDCANVNSAVCLQTSDRGVLCEDGFRLLGRDTRAVPRGCSLAVEEALASG